MTSNPERTVGNANQLFFVDVWDDVSRFEHLEVGDDPIPVEINFGIKRGFVKANDKLVEGRKRQPLIGFVSYERR